MRRRPRSSRRSTPPAGLSRGHGRDEPGGRPSGLMDALGLVAKEIGVDVHHLGDAGLGGSPDPEVVYRYSVAIRAAGTWPDGYSAPRGPP